MAEQSNAAGLEALKLRQEALLSKLTSLQLRVNHIKGHEHITYNTSHITAKQFKQLQSKQSQIFDRLLEIAGNVENIAFKQNIQLPAQKEIVKVIDSMAISIEKRQQRTLTQLKVLSTVAASIQSMSLTPEIKNLIMDEKEDKLEEKVSVNTYKSRYYDLELVSDALRQECKRMDVNNDGEIIKEQLNRLLEKVTLIGVDGSVANEKHIQIIIDSLCNANHMVNYNKFLDLVCDFQSTDKLTNVCKQWNLFRHNLIGKGRVEGLLRVLYRYDGWPEPMSFLIKQIETVDKNYVVLKQVLDYIKNNTKDVVEYEQIRYAENPTYVPGKRKWQALKSDDIMHEKVPFLLNNDGTLEIDIWLRTKGFVANGQGRPLPDENDDDLVDID